MARGVLLSLLLSGLLAAGCASVPPPPQRHYLLVHADGYPLTTKGRLPDRETFEREQVAAIRAGIDDYVKGYDPHEWPGKRPRPQLVLFIHGGLSPHAEGLARIQDFLDAQKDRRANPEVAASHFVFLNWDSDLWGSLVDDLCCIRQGDRSQLVGPLTAPFVGLARAAEAVFLAPRAWYFQAQNAVDGFREEAERDQCNPLSVRRVEDEEEERLNVPAAASFFAFYPLRFLSVPFIQSFGTSAWEMMKRRAALVFAREKALPPRDWVKEGAGRLLVNALREPLRTSGAWWLGGTEKRDLDVVLVGFSMGAFVVNRLLQEFPEIHFARIFYLGAASSIGDFEASVLPYLRQHRETREVKAAQFWSFSIAEADEAGQIDPPDVYERGSLLVWIDNYFERINTPTQRTFGRWRNLRLHFKTPEGFQGQIFLVKFDGRGWRDPSKHGDFDEPKTFDRLLRMREADCPEGRGLMPLRFPRR